jgi:kumamolisin
MDDFPASSPHILACGGTSLQSANGVITSETVWNDGAQGGATGGGFSVQFPLPTWQANDKIKPPTGGGQRCVTHWLKLSVVNGGGSSRGK